MSLPDFTKFHFALRSNRNKEKIRKAIRGHRVLAKADKLHEVEDAIQHLRDFKLPLESKSFSRIVWGSARSNAELIIRQTLSKNYIDLQEELLVAASSIKCFVEAPIPRIWCDQLNILGHPVNYSKCQLLWRLHLAKQILIGACFASSSLLIVLVNLIFRTCPRNPYVFFCDLAIANLPRPTLSDDSFCFVSWYVQKSGDFDSRYTLKHSVSGYKKLEDLGYKLEFQQHPIPNRLTPSRCAMYALCLFVQFVAIINSAIRGKWWNILLYREAVSSLRARLLDPDYLARQYWFHNSRLYPPLWTYELPAKGSRAVFYFYSANAWPLPRKDGSRPFVTPYSIMNWPEVCLWARSQHQFVQNTLSASSSFRYTSPIWFADTIDSGRLPANYIALFDVQPYRMSKYVKFCLPREYYVPNICRLFAMDVIAAITHSDIFIVLKTKRNIGSLAHPAYRKFLQEISYHPKVFIVDPGVSASHLIKNSCAVVSMPFTSTASLAMAESKPSIYYDPIAVFSLGDEYAGGIPLLNSKSSLESWINSVLALQA